MLHITKQIWRYLRNSIALLVLLLLLAIGSGIYYLQTLQGERFVREELLAFLSKQLKTEITAGDIEYRFPHTVILHDGAIQDQRDEEFVTFNRLQATLQHFNVANMEFFLRNVKLEDFVIHGYKYPGDSLYNFTYLLNNLRSGSTTGRKRPRLHFADISLKNGVFQIWNGNTERDSAGVDWNHIRVEELNAEVRNLIVDGSDVSAEVNDLSFHDISGFQLQHLQTNFNFSSKVLSFQKTYILTPQSRLRTDLAFRYNGRSELNDFIDKAAFDARVVESVVTLEDVAYFAPKLPIQSNEPVQVRGIVSGPVSDLRVDGFSLAFGELSELEGDIALKGLPKIENTVIDLHLAHAHTNAEDVALLLPEVPLPQELERFGTVTGEGRFAGYYHDFTSEAAFTTALGQMAADLELDLNGNSRKATYEGQLQLTDFEAGKALAQQELLGRVTLQANVQGKGLSLKAASAKISSQIQQLVLKGHPYQNITVEGQVAQQLWEGTMQVRDQALNVDLAGQADLSGPQPAFDVMADVTRAQLARMNLMKEPFMLRTKVAAQFTGSHIDSLNGQLFATGTRIRTGHQRYRFDTLMVTSTATDLQRQLMLTSEVADVSMTGQFSLATLPEMVQDVASAYLDTTFFDLGGEEVNDVVAFAVNLKQAGDFTNILLPGLTVQEPGTISGTLNARSNRVELKGKLAALTYKDLRLEQVTLSGSNKGGKLTLSGGAAHIFRNDSLLLQDVAFAATSNKEMLNFQISLADEGTQRRLNLNGLTLFYGDSAVMALDNSQLLVNGQPWEVEAQRIKLLPDTLIYIPKLTVSRGEQQIEINGNLTTDLRYPLDVQLRNVDLDLVRDLLPPKLQGLGGVTNATATLFTVDNDPVVVSEINVEPLIMGKDTIGSAYFTSSYHSKNKNLELKGAIETERGREVIDVNGNINFLTAQNLDINLELKRSYVAYFQEFLKGLVSDIGGLITANLHIGGTIEDPVLEGTATLENGVFTVDYLQTRYYIDHTFTFNEEYLLLDEVPIRDRQKNTGYATGRLRFNRLNKLYLDDIRIRIAQGVPFHVLNTQPSDNPLFFGEAYASGDIVFNGPLELIQMDMSLRSERGTDFNLPITEEETYSGPDFIRYIRPEEELFQQEFKATVGNFAMNANLEITEEALAKIIIDPRVGDIIAARGRGNIRLEYTPAGDFFIYGDYVIDEGDYLFTFMELINKHFVIEEGGRISWSGNPYGAQIDINALYPVRTTLTSLAPEEELMESNGKVLVNVELELQGELFSPDIGLDIQVPDMASENQISTAESILRTRVLNDEQEKNKQVIALLALGQFLPVTQGQPLNAGATAMSGVSNSVSGFVTNQLSLLGSSFSDNLELDIDYSSGNIVSRTEKELMLGASYSLLEDRLQVKANYRVNSAAQDNVFENVEVSGKMTRDGRLRLKIFRKADDNPIFDKGSVSYGVGFFFREQFDSLGELFGGKSKQEKQREEEEEIPEPADVEPDLAGR